MNWSNSDSLIASTSGWDIFNCIGSEGGVFQVQRVDDMGILKDDIEAHKIVANGTHRIHIYARKFLKEMNPKEYFKVMKQFNRKTVDININMTLDLDKLKAQKAWLLTHHGDEPDGIIGIIDAIQDHIADDLGFNENDIFDFSDEVTE
jgi:hypothetical protein